MLGSRDVAIRNLGLGCGMTLDAAVATFVLVLVVCLVWGQYSVVLRPHLCISAVGSAGADLRPYGVLISRVELLAILILILVRNETLIQV